MQNGIKIVITRRGDALSEKYVGIVTERRTNPSAGAQQRRYRSIHVNGEPAPGHHFGFGRAMLSMFSPFYWLVSQDVGWVNRGYQIRSFVNGLLLAGHEVWIQDLRFQNGKQLAKHVQQHQTYTNVWPYLVVGFAYGTGSLSKLEEALKRIPQHHRYRALDLLGKLIASEPDYFRKNGVSLSIPVEMVLDHFIY